MDFLASYYTTYILSFLLSFLYFQLLRNKADPNLVNEHGNTPLHYACFWGNQILAEDLIQAGASVSIANKYDHIPLDKCNNTVAKTLECKLTMIADVLLLLVNIYLLFSTYT